MTNEIHKHLRPIRSFVRREGRMTVAPRRALTELWSRNGLDSGGAMLDIVTTSY